MQVAEIAVSGLSCAYEGHTVLDGLTFEIASGEYVGLVGPNGSGKTTLVKALLGLVPYTGKVLWHGSDLAQGLPPWVGYLPQKATAVDKRFPASVRETIASGIVGTRGDARARAAAENAAECMGVADLLDRRIGYLSGGQQQRVFLARALAHEPRVLVLDEPTVALDPAVRDSFYETIARLHKERGMTVVLVSHDSATIGAYVTKMLYVDRSLVFFGRMDEFCRCPQMTAYFGHASQHVICHQH